MSALLVSAITMNTTVALMWYRDRDTAAHGRLSTAAGVALRLALGGPMLLGQLAWAWARCRRIHG